MKSIFLLFISFVASRAFALAGTGNGASLIDGTSRVEYEVGARRARVVAESQPGGQRQANQKNEQLGSYTLRGAYRADAGWQAGGTLQLTDRERRGARSTNLSEFKLNAGYRSQKPPMLTYVQLSVPVSRSAFEIGDPYQLDALGRGFWALGAGQLFALPKGFFLTYEVHRSLKRNFANAENAGFLRPGFGATGGGGYATTFGRVSAGASIIWTYEDPVFVRGDRKRKNGSAQRFVSPGVNVGYDFGAWTVAVSYVDQNIFPAATTGLLREVGLSVAFRQ